MNLAILGCQFSHYNTRNYQSKQRKFVRSLHCANAEPAMARIIEALRGALRSDAVPRDPRPPQETSDDVTRENPNNQSESTTINDQEEIFIGPENVKQDKKQKKKAKDGTSKKSKGGSEPENDGAEIYNLNTQATGSVFTVLKSPDFHWGNTFVYNLGPVQHNSKTSDSLDEDEEHIEKSNDIILLMEAKISPEHDYIDYVSKNLGKNWHSFFRKLGYSKGRIETFEIDEAFRNGVSEARYQLLLDWMRNDKDGSLGRLATILWAAGERQIVKELSIIYSTNNKNNL